MENLGIDIKLITAQIASFAIFYFVFSKFISAPLTKYLKAQKEQEELREKLAKDLAERNEKLEKKDREMDRERKKALDKALAEGKKDADVVKLELIEEAKKEAATVVKKARELMEEERERMYKDMRKQIADVSIMMVDKALNEYLTPEAKKAVTKHIISHVPETKLEN
ncbi:ATP synthase F0 subunit B [Candidatus Woesebacteria bacterium]|nr:ATP synthase F0 subunit B [Candidatus Woesebacteria bacterium]